MILHIMQYFRFCRKNHEQELQLEFDTYQRPSIEIDWFGGTHETDATTYKWQVSYPEMLSNTVISYVSLFMFTWDYPHCNHWNVLPPPHLPWPAPSPSHNSTGRAPPSCPSQPSPAKPVSLLILLHCSAHCDVTSDQYNTGLHMIVQCTWLWPSSTLAFPLVSFVG